MDEREKRQKQEGKSEDNREDEGHVRGNKQKRKQRWVSQKMTVWGLDSRVGRERKKSDYSHIHRAKHHMLALEVLTLHA